jgi:glycosyltransferase involved in cell wall biosynthesis
MAASGGPSVAAENLGELTVSMLAGEEGHQRKELLKLVHWLKHEARPELVHLSNSMFVGMAKSIRALGIPVVCTLSGEDIFLEKLPQPFYDQARRLLRQNARHVDAFVAMNEYYAQFMSEYLEIDRARVQVIEHGLDLTGHGAGKNTPPDDVKTIGFFARICPEKGLHLLVAAFEELLKDSTLPPIRLRVAGYLGTLDRPYLEGLLERVKTWDRPELFEYVGEVSRSEKIAFLHTLSVFSLPTVYAESKGISALEAMANGVPVVLPAHGGFPEMVASTGGGLLHEPGDPLALAAAIKELLVDEHRADAFGDAGQKSVQERFRADKMAGKTAELYYRLLSDKRKLDVTEALTISAEPVRELS